MRASLVCLMVWLGLAGAPALAQAPAASVKPPVLVALDAEFGHTTSTSDEGIKMGMLTAIDEINASGGVLGGRMLSLIERDSRSVPSRGRDNFQELAGIKDVVAVFVGKFSPVALEQAPLANTLKLPLLDPWAAADDIVAEKPAGTYTFRLSLRDSWAIPVMMRHLRDRGIKQVGVLLPTSGWGRSNEAQINRYAAQGGLPKVVGSYWYNWGAKSLRDEYAKLRAAGAQAILFVGNEGEGALLVREMADLPAGERVPVVSHWGVAGGNFTQLTGAALQQVDFAVVQTFTFNGRTDAKTRAVVARATRLFNLKGAEDIPAHVGFAHAYDLTHVLARAIAIAGSSDRVAIRDALEKVRDYNGLMGRFAQPFSPSSHEALNPGYVFMGRFLPNGSVQRITR